MFAKHSSSLVLLVTLTAAAACGGGTDVDARDDAPDSGSSGAAGIGGGGAAGAGAAGTGGGGAAGASVGGTGGAGAGGAGAGGAGAGGAGAGGAGAGGASGSGGPPPEGPSCEGMVGNECQGSSCCSHFFVPGGTFPMGRSENGTDAFSDGYSTELPEHNATVADFYLDEYEVTVGRFRRFVEQFDGTPPPQGSAAHPLIAGSGWQAAWELTTSQSTLISNLNCMADYQTWRDAPDGTEELPVNCVNWYEAFAFCAWDGGRLPTEAEWEYAAAGGSENRLYPWGNATPDSTLASFDCSYCGFDGIETVGSFPAGAGRWGHKDLAGSMQEFVLDWFDGDWYAGAGAACDNCANWDAGLERGRRGGSFVFGPKNLRAVQRLGLDPREHFGDVGFRCARSAP